MILVYTEKPKWFTWSRNILLAVVVALLVKATLVVYFSNWIMR